MQRFKMRGDVLYDSRNFKIGYIKGNNVYDKRNFRIGSFKDEKIFDKRNFKIAYLRGDKVYDNHNHRIGDVDDIRKEVKDAMGGLSLVALWLFFVR